MADENGTPWLKIVLICAAAIVLIAVIVIIYRYQRYLGKTQPMLRADPISASSGIDINGAKAPLSETGREYTYNMWFNIRDWESGYGQPKCVLHRASKDPTGNAPDCPSNPSIWFYPKENKMMVRVSTMKSDSEDYDPNVYPEYDIKSLGKGRNERYTIVNPLYKGNIDQSTGKPLYLDTTYACDIGNLPLQRWVQVTVVMWNRTLDITSTASLSAAASSRASLFTTTPPCPRCSLAVKTPRTRSMATSPASSITTAPSPPKR